MVVENNKSLPLQNAEALKTTLNSDELNSIIINERNYQYIKRHQTSTVLGVVVSLYIVYFQFDNIDLFALSTWWLLVLIVNFFIFLWCSSNLIKLENNEESAGIWQLIALQPISGLVYGSSILWITDWNNSISEFFNLLMLNGIASTSSIINIPIRNSCNYFNISIVFFPVCYLIYKSDITHLNLLLAIVLLLVTLHILIGLSTTQYMFGLEQRALSVALSSELRDSYEKIKKEANIDYLTSAYNRRHGIERIKKKLEESEISRKSISMIMIDIDNFKQVNDTYGHLAGDQVLISFSKNILSLVRDDDIFMRFGGEEFLLVLPETEPEGAIIFSERLRLEIENTAINIDTLNEPTTIKITCCFGVTQISSSQSLQEAILKADKALYIAKNNGRNCVEVLL
jgi:diguanylate cyclase (GGDEF)-like protein